MTGRDRTAAAARLLMAGAGMIAIATAAAGQTPPSTLPTGSPATSGDAAAAAAGPSVDPQLSGASEAAIPQTNEEIVVTGSRIARNGFNTPTPVTVVGAARLQEVGASSVGEVLAQLPSFRATTSPTTQGVSVGTGGARTVDLRGLGAARSLVLVDGRRFVASTAAGAVDTNLIPSLLIDRVELVTGGASAAYGSDAVAGVVNFILNKRLEGVRFNVQGGVNERGEDGDQLVGLAAGTRFAEGRGHVVIGGEYNNNSGIGSCYENRLCRQEYQVLTNSRPGVNGLPAQIVSSDVHTATQTYAGKINAPAPLANIQFDDNGNPVPFVVGQFPGLFMQGGSGDGQNAFRSAGVIKVPVSRYALYGHAEYEAGAFTPFLDVSYGRVKVTTPGGQTRDTALIIRRDNPFLPAPVLAQLTALNAQTLTLGRVGQDLGFAIGTNITKTVRGATGFSLKLNDDWSADAYYQYGQTDASQLVRNNRITANFNRAVDAVRDPATGAIVCRDTLSADAAVRAAAQGCAPLNLFGQNKFSAAAKAYTFGTAEQYTTLKQHVAAANIQGKLFDLGAGPVSIAAGAEYRREQSRGTADPISRANGFYVSNGSAFSPGPIKVTEGYGEIVVPLLRDVTLARSLEFNGAVRRTHYSTSGSVTTWKLGGSYEPVEGFRLRATRSRDIRAPNASELYSPLVGLQASVFDTRTNTQVLARTFRGGNSALFPEVADTFTVGGILQPAFLRGLRFSVDYYDIKIRDAIALVGAQVIANRCNGGAQEFCAKITRDPVTGLITTVNDQYFNVNRQKTRGLDFELDWVNRFASGDVLSLRALANYTFNLTTIDSLGSVDRAGQTGLQVSGSPGVPDYSVDATVNYEHGPIGVTLQGRYIPSGKYEATLVGPDSPNFNPAASNSISDNTVDDWYTFTLSARYTIKAGGNRSLQFYGAIVNLFDKDPPLSPGNAYTNPIFFDQSGRGFRAGARLSF